MNAVNDLNEAMKRAADYWCQQKDPIEGSRVATEIDYWRRQLSNVESERSEQASCSPLQSVAQSATDADGPLNPARSDGPLDAAVKDLDKLRQRLMLTACGESDNAYLANWLDAEGRELLRIVESIEQIKCEAAGRGTQQSDGRTDRAV